MDKNPEEGKKLTIQELYRSPIRTVCVVFGSVFNNITVRRYDAEGKVISKRERVPLEFSDKSAYGLWLEQKMRLPSGTLEIGNKFPRMSYTMTSLGIDNQRMVNVNLRRTQQYIENGLTHSRSIRNVVPYQFGFTLSVWSKDMSSMLQILDQILPYFKPEVAIKVLENSDIRIINDYKIVLGGISKSDNFLDGFDENRIITYDLDFTVNASISEPSGQGSIIQEITIDLIQETDETCCVCPTE